MDRLLGPGVYDLMHEGLLVGVASVLDDKGNQLWVLSANQAWGPAGREHRLALRAEAPADADALRALAKPLGAGARSFVVRPAAKGPRGPGKVGQRLELDPGSMSLHQDGALVGAVHTERSSAAATAEAWVIGRAVQRVGPDRPLVLRQEAGAAEGRARHAALVKRLGAGAVTTTLVSRRVDALPSNDGQG